MHSCKSADPEYFRRASKVVNILDRRNVEEGELLPLHAEHQRGEGGTGRSQLTAEGTGADCEVIATA